MNLYRTFLIVLLSTSLLVACKVTDTKIVGSYIDGKKGDTLRLFADKTFEYQEKLSYGEFGWNTGNWAIIKNRISFFNVKPDPVVGYRLQKEIKGSIKEPLKITLLLNASKKLITITNVSVSFRNTVLDTSYFRYNLNTLTINTNSFDSISVATSYFPPFLFKQNEFEKNKKYEVTIYQAERLFELDKYFFEYKKKSLLNHSERIKFKKYRT